jgi:hypothetical protein
LHIASAQATVIAERIAMLHLTGEQHGDCLEASMRVIGKAWSLAGSEVDRTKLIEK